MTNASTNARTNAPARRRPASAGRVAVRVAALVAAACAGPAVAATSWSTPAGSSGPVTYSDGQTQNGLFTASGPGVADGRFVFGPQNFRASGDDGRTANDVAWALISAQNGRNLTRVTADLGGDWSTLGSGVVYATGLLTVTNPFTHAVLTKPFDFTGDFSSPAGDGAFGDDVAIVLPAGWKSATLALSAGVAATADAGSTSFVQLKTASFGVETTQVAAVPLPPAVLAAIPTVAVAYFARRRMARA